MDLRASKIFQDGNEIEQFVVVRVTEPTADRDCMLRVEDVTRRAVVNNDRVLEVASDLAEILDVVALMIVAALSEQSMMHHFVYVELVKQGIAVL